MNGYPTEEKLPVLENFMRFSKNNTTAPKIMAHLHWHNVYEVLYIRRGWGEQRINTETYSFHPGEVVILLPGDLHATEAVSENGCDIDYVQFSGEFLHDEMCFGKKLRSGVIHSENSEFKQIFDAFNKFKADNGSGQPIIMAGLMHILAGFILRACQNDKAPVLSGSLNKLLEYLETANDLRLGTISGYIGYSPEHLSRKFKKETGTSYRSYCDRIRMRRAVAMLNDEKNSIAYISEALGYSEESSFVRAFRRMYGITPGLCRNRLSVFRDEKE